MHTMLYYESLFLISHRYDYLADTEESEEETETEAEEENDEEKATEEDEEGIHSADEEDLVCEVRFGVWRGAQCMHVGVVIIIII